MRAAVRQIVAVDRCEDDVLETHERDGPGRILDLLRVEPAPGIARVDGAEAARARADRAHEHDRRRAVHPALADVRTHRLLADRRKPMRPHGILEPQVALARRNPGLEPRRLRQRRIVPGVATDLLAVLDGREALCGPVFRTRTDYRDAAELGHGLGVMGLRSWAWD